MSQFPHTYQQWMDCFQRLQANPRDLETLAQVRGGTCSGTPSELFLSRLSDTVSVMLSGCTRKFLRQLDQTLADGEPDMAVLLAKRLRKQLRDSMFYRDLPFLSQTYIETLDTGYAQQLQAFWQDLLKQLDKTARESMNPAMEDLAQELRRIRLTDSNGSEKTQ